MADSATKTPASEGLKSLMDLMKKGDEAQVKALLEKPGFKSNKILSMALGQLLGEWDKRYKDPAQESKRISSQNVLKFGEILLSAGASTNIKFYEDSEPLMQYLLSPQMSKNYRDNLRLDFAQMVLEFIPDVSEYNESFQTCLVDKTMEFESKYDRESNLRCCPMIDRSTVSHEKIVKLVKTLISKGAREPAQSDDDMGDESKFYSWLHMALYNLDRDPEYELIDAILPYCQVNALSRNEMLDYDEHTPLHRCVKENNLVLVKKLLAAGADPNAESGHYSPLIEAACFMNGGEMFKVLLDAGSKVDCVGHNSNNLLHILCADPTFWKSEAFNPVEVMRYLVDNGVDINARNNPFYKLGTPLMLALITKESGDDTVVKLLIKENCDLSMPYEFISGLSGRDDITKESFGNMPFKLDWTNVTALEYALLKGMVSTTYILLSAGSPYDTKTVEKSLSYLKNLKTPGGRDIALSTEKDKDIHMEYISMIEAFISQPRSLKRLSCTAIKSTVCEKACKPDCDDELEFNENMHAGEKPLITKENVGKLTLPSQLKDDVMSCNYKHLDELPVIEYKPRFEDVEDLQVQMHEAQHFWAAFLSDHLEQFHDDDHDAEAPFSLQHAIYAMGLGRLASNFGGFGFV